jgi:hypothetical protein
MDAANHSSLLLGPLLSAGYVVYDALPPSEAAKLATLATTRVCQIFLQGITDLRLLVDHNLRLRTMRPFVWSHGSHDPLWRNGCSRTPAYSKSTGMVNSYLAPWSIHLHLDPRIVDVVSLLYDARGLEPLLEDGSSGELKDRALSLTPKDVGYTHGLDRYSLKVDGCTDMQRHLDRLPFLPRIPRVTTEEILERPDSRAILSPHLDRLQTLLCSSIDEKVKPRDSGTLELLPRAHLYWELLGILLEQQELCVAVSPPVELGGRFDTLLPWLNEQFETYSLIYSSLERDEGTTEERGGIVSAELEAACLKLISRERRASRRDGVICSASSQLPWCPRRFSPLAWEPIGCSPGQAITWDSRLPHRNLRCKKTTVPRIAHYFSLYEVPEGYNLSPLHRSVWDSIHSGSFGDGRGRGSNRDNSEELHWLDQRHPGADPLANHKELIASLDERARRLLCISPRLAAS